MKREQTPHVKPQMHKDELQQSNSLRTISRVINPVSILYKSTAGRYRPVRVADGPITGRCRFIKNASWVLWGEAGWSVEL